MYVLHRLTRNSQDFIASFVSTARASSPACSFAIAAVLVNAIDFTKPSDSPYFSGLHEQRIMGQLSSINEVLRINPDDILGYARKLVGYRQSLLKSGLAVPVITSSESAIMDFFSISRFFSKDDLNILTISGEKISVDMLAFKTVFDELGFFTVDDRPAPPTSVPATAG